MSESCAISFLISLTLVLVGVVLVVKSVVLGVSFSIFINFSSLPV